MLPSAPLSIRQTFAGKGVLLTGSTGFLAKAVAEKILRDLPDVGQIYLLIRPRVKGDGSRVEPRERLKDEILRNSAFGRLREQLGADFDSFCESKITCVPGDLTSERLGLDEDAFADLAKKVQIIINSAATVVFDERLDLALDLNTLSPQRLLEFARKANAIYVHISTAYVSGMRSGHVPEKLLPPLEAIDAQLEPGVKRPEHFDVEEEVERLRQLVESVKKECERILRERKISEDSEEGRTQMRTALVSAGMRRAQSLGWNDTYTYTKFLGEQLIKLKHGKTGTIVVRPSIIESSLREPEPGWLDGLRMADPIIIGFGKGRLADFPANRDVVLDIIPADLVVNGILAAAAHIQKIPGGFDLITIASSSENPLVFQSLYDHVRDYFQKHPMTDRAGKPVAVPSWRFPTIPQYKRKMSNRYIRPIKFATSILSGPIPVPGSRRMRSRLRNLSSTLEQLLYYVDIYGPYVNLHCRFETVHARELMESLAPDERETFDFDPKKIRWKNYLQDVHIPGLKRNILRMDSVPRAGAGEGHLLDEEGAAMSKRRATSVRGVPQTVVDLCARGSEKFGNKSFVEIRRGGSSVTRITYQEMFDRSADLARKLIAKLGLQPFDRIALFGENCPEWALAYMSISRACCTAVPLDRQMPPRDIVKLLKLVDAKALLVSPTLFETIQKELGGTGGLPPCLDFLREFSPHSGQQFPYPEASIGDRALKEPTPEALASILFTSGTTLDPKGVMLSHANLVADALSVAEVLEPMQTDRFLSVLPMHHAFEFTCGCLIPMYGGSTIHHIEVLRGKEVLDAMKLAEITVVLGVPRLFKLFMDGVQGNIDAAGTAKKFTVRLGKQLAGAMEFAGGSGARRRIFHQVHDAFGGHLRLFVSGGAPLDPEIYEFFKSFGIKICEGYGLTETSPVLTVNPISAPKAGSVGPPVPGVEVQIHAPDGEGIGEVRARGHVVMHGYWHNPAATERAFENGWFKTGDLGRLDKDGYLHITGRLKDVIVTAAGKNVYPDEIESALRDVAGVKEFCVVGLPARSGMGEEVAVIVVPNADGSREKISAAIEEISRGLPSHQRIARVEFQADDLPKTSTLKVQRSKVRERYSTAPSARAESLPAFDAAQPVQAADSGSIFVEVARAVAEVAGKIAPSEVTPAMKLQMDLGIDSIGRVDLLQKLELQLNITIPHDAERNLFTVRDVVSVVETVMKSGKTRSIREKEKRLLISGSLEDVQAGMKPSFSKSMLQGMFSTTASVFMNTYLSVECKGRENIPASGPYILAANHSSHLDSIAVREILGKRAADLHVMGAKDYFFDTRLKSWFFTTFLNALPFDREENISESLAACKAVLDSGRAILLFPEGTRSVTGELQPFKPGIGVLAIELNVPVIPVYLKGTYESLPKGKALPRPTRIAVRVGKPVDFSQLRQEKTTAMPSELYRRAANELRKHFEAMS